MDRKWTHVMFAVGGILTAWLLSKFGEWGWSYFGRPNTTIIGGVSLLVAGVATYTLWKSEHVFTLDRTLPGSDAHS